MERFVADSVLLQSELVAEIARKTALALPIVEQAIYTTSVAHGCKPIDVAFILHEFLASTDEITSGRAEVQS